MNPTIKSISFENLKGRSAVINFSPLTAIIAPNGEGKSSVIDAIHLAMTGSHPALPKTNQGIMALASGPTMKTSVTLSDGTQVSRGWVMNGSGSVKASASEPDGWDASIAGLAFSPAEFMRLSQKNRAKILLGTSAENIHLPEIETLRDKIDTECSGPKRVTINEIDPFDEKLKDPATFLDVLEEEAVESRKALKRDKSRLEQTIQGMTDALRTETAPLAVSGEEVDASQATMYELNEKATRLSERHRATGRQRDRAKGVDASSAWTAADAAKMEEVRKEVSRIEGDMREIKAFEDRKASILKGSPEPEEVSEARAELAAIEAIPVPSISRSTAEERLATVLSSLSDMEGHLKQSSDESTRLKLELGQLNNSECCPTCGSAVKDVKNAILNRYGALLEEQDAIRKKISNDLTESNKQKEELQEIIGIWDRRKGEAEAKAVIEHDARVDRELEELNATVRPFVQPDSLETALATLRELEVKQSAAKALEDIGELVTDDQVEAAAQAASAAELERSNHETAFRDLKSRREAFVAYGAQETRLIEMRDNLRIAGEKLEAVEKIVAEAVECKNLLSARIIGPMMATVNYFLDGILPGRLEADGAEMTYTDSRGSRPFVVLSGSERAVIAFSLGAALASKSKSGFVMLDELNVLDSKRRAQFVARIQTAVSEGILAQAIVIDHNSADLAGWDIVKP